MRAVRRVSLGMARESFACTCLGGVPLAVTWELLVEPSALNEGAGSASRPTHEYDTFKHDALQ